MHSPFRPASPSFSRTLTACRFIHDIVTATLRSTGFPGDYFSPDELQAKTITDKPSKIAFLEKLVRVVEACAGMRTDARPSKIVAGLEPLNTNVLLAALGRAAVDPIPDREGTVRRCLAGAGGADGGRDRDNDDDDDFPEKGGGGERVEKSGSDGDGGR